LSIINEVIQKANTNSVVSRCVISNAPLYLFNRLISDSTVDIITSHIQSTDSIQEIITELRKIFFLKKGRRVLNKNCFPLVVIVVSMKNFTFEKRVLDFLEELAAQNYQVSPWFSDISKYIIKLSSQTVTSNQVSIGATPAFASDQVVNKTIKTDGFETSTVGEEND